MKRVDVIEVKRAFILSNMCNEIFDWSVDSNILSEEYNCCENIVKCLSPQEIDDKLHDIRVEKYNSMIWHFVRKIPIDLIGAYPRMAELSEDDSIGNIVSTAEKFEGRRKSDPTFQKDELEPFKNEKNVLVNSNGFGYIKNEKKVMKKLSLKLDSIILNIEFIKSNFPLILYTGHEIRKSFPLSDVCDYDIDDGNHRALAYACNSQRNVSAFVGSYDD
jgi:hypothetical protein